MSSRNIYSTDCVLPKATYKNQIGIDEICKNN
jgi:hypothetical protein